MPRIDPPRKPGEPAAVQVIPCSSWDEFKSQLRLEHYGPAPLYRGHAQAEWQLASPWERELELSGPRRPEDNKRLLDQLLESFKDITIGLPGIRTFDLHADDDWWTLGRHYGLATPLLDWTRSPFVAAFFAFTGLLEQVSPGATTLGSVDILALCSPKSAEKVAIWSFAIQSMESGPPPGLEIVSSRTDIGHRQRAQRGVFTRLTNDTHLCLEDYLESLQPKHPLLRKYIVPGWAASDAIRDLRMMNITFATLFPDLTGAALQANFEMAMSTLDSLASLPSDIWNSIVGPRKGSIPS